MNSKHVMWMLIGCILPLLFIFFAPALGLGSNVSLLIFIVAMFACHLLMPHGHGGHQQHGKHEHSPQQKQDHHSPQQKQDHYERHTH